MPGQKKLNARTNLAITEKRSDITVPLRPPALDVLLLLPTTTWLVPSLGV